MSLRCHRFFVLESPPAPRKVCRLAIGESCSMAQPQTVERRSSIKTQCLSYFSFSFFYRVHRRRVFVCLFPRMANISSLFLLPSFIYYCRFFRKKKTLGAGAVSHSFFVFFLYCSISKKTRRGRRSEGGEKKITQILFEIVSPFFFYSDVSVVDVVVVVVVVRTLFGFSFFFSNEHHHFWPQTYFAGLPFDFIVSILISFTES